jgi:hypothetical protein
MVGRRSELLILVTLASLGQSGQVAVLHGELLPPFVMTECARLGTFYAQHRFICGDADRDGRVEVYVRRQGSDTAFALEHRGGFDFDVCPLALEDGYYWALGYSDADSAADLVLQNGANLLVAEGTGPSSLPDSVVWRRDDPDFACQLRAAIGDLDGDSVPDITVSTWVAQELRMYENCEDDSYALAATFKHQSLPPCHDMVLTHDLDRDGRPELLAGLSDGGHVLFYEAAGNDSVVCVAVCPLMNETGQLTAVASAPDMDRDGRPEAIVYGVDMHHQSLLAVLESPCNDSFVPVWSANPPTSYFSDRMLAVGDVNGDGIPEFATTNEQHVRLYACVGDDQYELVWESPCRYEALGLYDIDGDGCCEVILDSTWATVIWRYSPGGVAVREAERLRGVEISPSVLRPGARLHLSDLPPDARVELLDISGRVRASPDLALGIGDLSLRPGAYFVRITSGSQSITRKVLVVE